MEIAQCGYRLRLQQWNVPREHQQLVISLDGLLRDLDGMPRSALLRLLHEADAGILYSGLDRCGLVADDDINVPRRNDLAGARDHVTQQRPAPDFMKHFGALRLEARALASGHDDNC
jgi:hypothetical protein